MAQAVAWVNLEDITPRGGCQTPKATYPMTLGQEVVAGAGGGVWDWAGGGRGRLGFFQRRWKRPPMACGDGHTSW